jgi:hypothetical protein
MEIMIVKIQASLASSDGVKSCLIYDKSRDVMYETSDPKETKPLLKLLKGRDKAYFNAEIVNTKIEVHEEEQYQNW